MLHLALTILWYYETHWGWYLGVETCSSWHWTWSVFCDSLVDILNVRKYTAWITILFSNNTCELPPAVSWWLRCHQPLCCSTRATLLCTLVSARLIMVASACTTNTQHTLTGHCNTHTHRLCMWGCIITVAVHSVVPRHCTTSYSYSTTWKGRGRTGLLRQ